MSHEIYYDDRCKLCLDMKKEVEERDPRKQFTWIPLSSQQANSTLSPDLKGKDTIVLIEESGKTWIEGKAVLRILGKLGWKGMLLAPLGYLLPVNILYRFIAKNRQ